MRRKDREVTEPAKIEDIVNDCMCCRVGFNDSGSVYIVPLSYGWKRNGDSFVFYFHSALQGRKIDIIGKNPKVGFEMDTGYEIKKAKTACGHSARYKSITGTGKISIVKDMSEKEEGLRLIMRHNTGRSDWDFDARTLDRTAVLKLETEELCCKANE